jgi:hypothetical protein
LSEAKIPAIETYRGVPVHDFQPRDRIDSIVKPAIDNVLAIDDMAALLAVAFNILQPPEARLLAAAKIKAQFELAAERREARPEVDLDGLRAETAGLDSLNWADPDHYGSLFDLFQCTDDDRLPKRDAACGERLQRAKRAAEKARYEAAIRKTP